MIKIFKIIAAVAILSVSGGCCIASRCWKIDKEITGNALPASGSYHYYTNGLKKAYIRYIHSCQSNVTFVVDDVVYKHCSNANGPWKGSDIYPATRNVLNCLSFMSYSSPASGDYMLNIVILPCYPIILCELPIQLLLDTVLLPWDALTAPTTPEGYRKVF